MTNFGNLAVRSAGMRCLPAAHGSANFSQSSSSRRNSKSAGTTSPICQGFDRHWKAPSLIEPSSSVPEINRRVRIAGAGQFADRAGNRFAQHIVVFDRIERQINADGEPQLARPHSPREDDPIGVDLARGTARSLVADAGDARGSRAPRAALPSS